MRRLTKYIFIALCTLLFSSCSLTFGGLVAIDNSTHDDSRVMNINELFSLEIGSRVIIELTDSTVLSGVLKGVNKIENEAFTVTILDDKEQIRDIKENELKKCSFVDEGASIWTAIFIGSVIDAIIIYAGSKSSGGLGNARIF